MLVKKCHPSNDLRDPSPSIPLSPGLQPFPSSLSFLHRLWLVSCCSFNAPSSLPPQNPFIYQPLILQSSSRAPSSLIQVSAQRLHYSRTILREASLYKIAATSIIYSLAPLTSQQLSPCDLLYSCLCLALFGRI